MALWSGRPSWLGRLGLVLLATWLIILIVSVSHVLRSSSYDEVARGDRENAQKLATMMEEFEILQKQNEALASLLATQTSRGQFDIEKIHEVTARSKDEPLLEYEELRRKIKNNIQELWYYVTAEFKKVKKYADEFPLDNKGKDIEKVLSNVWEYKKTLMLDWERISQKDGHHEWREKESKDLTDLVQRRFYHLQNPSDCNKAKKLTCNLNKGCGFGCQIHHLAYCFMVAYGTERTLILKSKGWRYHKGGFEAVFRPLSDTCLLASGVSHSNWPGDPSKQVLILPIVDNVIPKPSFQPPAVPADLVPRIQKLHGRPIVWWVGQVLKFLLKPQDHITKFIDHSKEKLHFAKPIVGIHVRRTDKIGTEAAFHDIDEYMVKVDHYYDQLETEPIVRRVFIASDDPKVITLARDRYKRYEVIGDPAVAETASVSKRYSDSSLHGIILDIHLLSLCDHLVCTFSSQVCRAAYELMQTYHVDAHDKFTSLDDIYYYGGQNPNPHVAILDHVPRRVEEIELRIGDKVEVYGNLWNGFSNGRNMRTSVIGLFPSFKTRNPVASVEFPKYSDVPLYKNSTGNH